MCKNYKDCLFSDKIILESQQRFKSDCYNVYTEQINNITLGSNGDKRLQQLKQFKNIFMIMKILHWSQNKKKHLMSL